MEILVVWRKRNSYLSVWSEHVSKGACVCIGADWPASARVEIAGALRRRERTDDNQTKHVGCPDPVKNRRGRRHYKRFCLFLSFLLLQRSMESLKSGMVVLLDFPAKDFLQLTLFSGCLYTSGMISSFFFTRPVRAHAYEYAETRLCTGTRYREDTRTRTEDAFPATCGIHKYGRLPGEHGQKREQRSI